MLDGGRVVGEILVFFAEKNTEVIKNTENATK